MVKRALDPQAPVPAATRQRTLLEWLPRLPPAPQPAASPASPLASSESASLAELRLLSVEAARRA